MSIFYRINPLVRRQRRKVERYIKTGAQPTTLPPGMTFCLPGGGLKHRWPTVLSAIQEHDPALILLSLNRAEYDEVMDEMPTKYVERVVWERHARDTVENARFSACLAADNHKQNAVLFTQRFHLPRAHELYEYWGFRDMTKFPTDSAGANLDRAQREAEKWLSDRWELILGGTRSCPEGMG